MPKELRLRGADASPEPAAEYAQHKGGREAGADGLPGHEPGDREALGGDDGKCSPREPSSTYDEVSGQKMKGDIWQKRGWEIVIDEVFAGAGIHRFAGEHGGNFQPEPTLIALIVMRPGQQNMLAACEQA